MTLTHLNSDQRQYFWMSLLLAVTFAYLTPKVGGLPQVFAVLVIVLEGGCALSIYRGWRQAPWIYLLGCILLIGWVMVRFITTGYTHLNLGLLIGGLLSTTGFYWLQGDFAGAKALHAASLRIAESGISNLPN